MALTRRLWLGAAVAAIGGAGLTAKLLAQRAYAFNPGDGPDSGSISGMGLDDENDLSRLQVADNPGKLPPITFMDDNGKGLSLQDYLGHDGQIGAVVNFWATWCGPCVAELPSLDALAGILRPRHIPVLALASDRGGADQVRHFYASHEIRNLAILLDPMMAAASMVGVRGVPTTLVIDSRGRERARLEGGADWQDSRLINRIESLIAAT